MKMSYLRQALAVAMFLLALLPMPATAADGNTNSGMKGDEAAVKVARGIVEAIGGKDVWAPMRSLYVRELVRAPWFDGLLAEEVWRDLEQPKERYEVVGDGLEMTRVWQSSGGWVNHSQRGFRTLTEKEIVESEAFWPGDVYIMYHRLAKEDPLLSVALDEEGLLQISEDGLSRGWFQVNVTGEPIRWGLDTGAEAVEYVFGPLKAFGKINFPAWGSATDASWRYWYTVVIASGEPVAFDTEPPTGAQ